MTDIDCIIRVNDPMGSLQAKYDICIERNGINLNRICLGYPHDEIKCTPITDWIPASKHSYFHIFRTLKDHRINYADFIKQNKDYDSIKEYIHNII